MFNGTTFHLYMYAVLAAQATNERITIHDSFPSPFRTMLWRVIGSFAGRLL